MEIGIDVVDLERIQLAYERYGLRFLQKFMTEREIALCCAKPQPVASIAGRFAAKEAVVKALGSGFSGGVHWKSIEVLNDARGRPVVHTHAFSLYPPGSQLKVSIAHERKTAVAIAMMEP